MNVVPFDLDERDDIGFVQEARAIVGGVLRTVVPVEAYVVKVDTWFSERWLGFAYKALGAIGISFRVSLRVPPFVPNRIVAERYFRRDTHDYVRTDAPLTLHIDQRSEDNARRHVSTVCPNAALFWWSGASLANGRASLMAYLPGHEGHTAWYAELARADSWRVSKAVGTSPVELHTYASAASAVSLERGSFVRMTRVLP